MNSRKRANRPEPSNSQTTRGIALVAVLWAVMLLALMAQSFTTDVRTGTQLTQNLLANAEAQELADAAVEMTIERLLSERTDADRVYDGRPYQTTVGGAVVEISVQDENGKINLNTASAAYLERLIVWAGVPADSAQTIIDAIGDWRDRDSLRRVNGAEESDYRQANLGYGPKNQAFDSVEELRLVLGITPALFAKIKPTLTVYSRQRDVNLRVATPTVLSAIINDEAQTKAYLEERSDGANGAPALDLPKDFTASSSRNSSSSRNATVTIRATAKTANGATFTREAVVRPVTRRGHPYTILAWRRGSDNAQ